MSDTNDEKHIAAELLAEALIDILCFHAARISPQLVKQAGEALTSYRAEFKEKSK